jgi:hypothetical protein
MSQQTILLIAEKALHGLIAHERWVFSPTRKHAFEGRDG